MGNVISTKNYRVAVNGLDKRHSSKELKKIIMIKYQINVSRIEKNTNSTKAIFEFESSSEYYKFLNIYDKIRFGYKFISILPIDSNQERVNDEYILNALDVEDDLVMDICPWYNTNYDEQLNQKSMATSLLLTDNNIAYYPNIYILCSLEYENYYTRYKFDVGYGRSKKIVIGERFGSKNHNYVAHIVQSKCFPEIFEKVSSDLTNVIKHTNTYPYNEKSGFGIWISVSLACYDEKIIVLIKVKNEISNNVKDVIVKKLNYCDSIHIQYKNKTECIHGPEYITFPLFGYEIKIFPGTLIPINFKTYYQFISTILQSEFLNNTSHLIDIYCGCGVTSCLFSAKFQVIGIDQIQKNIELATETNFQNCTFICGKISDTLRNIDNLILKSSVVLIQIQKHGCLKSIYETLIVLGAPLLLILTDDMNFCIGEISRILMLFYSYVECFCCDLYPNTRKLLYGLLLSIKNM